MALQDNIANVSISLETAAVTQAGFGTILFISDDQRFLPRVQSYTSITAVASDFDTTDKAYIAAQSAFSQSPTPTVVKIGRTDPALTTAALTPLNVAENTVYNLTVTVNDNDFIVATHTAGALDDAEAIATGLAADINGDVNVSAHVTATVVGVGASATLEIVGNVSGDTYALSAEQNLSIVYTSTEAAGDTLQAIIDEDNDFYFIASFDHTQAYILAMAAAVEALEKIYFVCVDDADSYATLAVPATDTLGKLSDLNYFRTSGWYHHEADTKFPEMTFIAKGSVYNPGTIVWANNRVAGITSSQNASGQLLTYTQRNNLNNRNANWVEPQGGVDITRTGKVAAGEWIDVVRSRDYWKARLTEGLQTKLINSTKIPYTDSGINEIRSVCNTVSDRLVTTPTQPNVLQEFNPYLFTFPKAADAPLADKQNRILRGTFVGYLAGAIILTELQGVLTYDSVA